MGSKILRVSMLVLVLGVILSAVWAYPLLPERIVSHWNASGEPDGYMSKLWGAFLLPVLLAFLSILFLILPKIDPFQKNISEFRLAYDTVLVSVVAFMAYLHALSLAWNLGFSFDFGRMLSPALGMLFIIIGVVLPHTKRNWFLGIRTPWTLLSDSVWQRTHKIGGQLFVFVGVVTLVLGFLMPESVFFATVLLVVSSVVWALIYSHFLYKNETKGQGNDPKDTLLQR